MIYITGDRHRDFSFLPEFCNRYHTSTDDVLIILGDAAINFYDDRWKDRKLKKKIAKNPITLLCIHGNHDKRPSNVPEYEEREWHGGIVYTEPEFPHILFAKDGEIYDFDGRKAMAIGGARSSDMNYRLRYDLPWFPDEQPSPEIRKYVEEQLQKADWKTDYIFSHTVPYRFIPEEKLLMRTDQDGTDYTTEHWLDRIEERLTYQKWYAGHYHMEKKMGKLRIMYHEIDILVN